MRPATFRTKALALASVLVCASSCAGKEKPRPTVAISAPADLLSRADEPPMPVEALTSEEAYERARDAKVEWGRGLAAQIDRACQYLKTAGVTSLECRD